MHEAAVNSGLGLAAALCPVLDFTFQDRYGTAEESPEPHWGFRNIIEQEGSTEQVGFICSVLGLSNGFGSVDLNVSSVRCLYFYVGAYCISRELRRIDMRLFLFLAFHRCPQAL